MGFIIFFLNFAVLDSYGKPESGILLGNLRWLGEYDECLGIYAPAKGNQGNVSVGDFHGKYCTLQIALKLGTTSLPLSLAVCLPDSCNTKGTEKNNAPMVLNSIGPLMNSGSFFGNATIKCKSTSRSITAGTVIVALILALISFLAVVGSSITAFEYYTNANASKESVEESHTTIELTTNGDVQSTTHDDTKKQISLPGN
ncbi:hypothetical protein AVEN_233973-1 [Araneus ventricosus]|uniref:Nose resistant-to-fluoxetine protein N-terminal domain-containing protein n=1 Tax=Araneus ventricosus TaxID=182803 RepID=A0A4Y2QAC5_ARAVE|nr:hypothetical protein AVEN_233973-1 [Araneus ventricosus]